MNPTFLSDIEKSAVSAFAANKVAFEAVKKVLLAVLYTNGTLKPDEPADSLRNWAMHIANADINVSNEQLGAELRANGAAVNMIESGFNKLLEVQPPKEPKKPKNPAL